LAGMQPEDIECFETATDGERRVFRFLREAARPHKDFTCWYQPSVGSPGEEVDFILFGKKSGLLVLEVKDWFAQQIISYNPLQFTIVVSGKEEKKTNPDKQAKGYVNTLKEWLKGIPEFLSDHPRYKGELKIPIGRMLAFPNISRAEYADTNFKWFIESERALFKEDLDPAGEILQDASGRKFQQKISKLFPFPFAGLTPKEIEKLSLILWPEGRIDLPPRQGEGKARFRKEVSALDKAQARLSLRLGFGHHIIKGPPGSGKTLVLVNRCCHLYRYQPEVKKILLVCFNIALVSYLRRLVQEKDIGTGEDGVRVFHFYELCAKVLGEKIRFENESEEYYQLVLQETWDRIKHGRSRLGVFDAVLIDEGQDFNDDMLRILLALLRPGGQLVISLDSYQDLYMRRPSWKSLGINASGRTHYLKKVYRNTKEIFEFTQCFIGQETKVDNQLALLPEDSSFHGDAPEILKFRDSGDLEEFLVKDLKDCVNRAEYRRSEIAIIYDDKVYVSDGFSYDNRALPMRLLRSLEDSGIPATWVSQNVGSKEMYDVTTDRVSLISIHSSKGLDFDLVYIVGLDHIHPTEETRQKLISLVYVAITRAKYRVVIPYVEETDLIRRIKDCRPI
jgi:UvrD-like helicase C-terminal domain/Nuclease-related domain/AAA domain